MLNLTTQFDIQIYMENNYSNDTRCIENHIINHNRSKGRDWMLNDIINIEKFISDNTDKKQDLKDNLLYILC